MKGNLLVLSRETSVEEVQLDLQVGTGAFRLRPGDQLRRAGERHHCSGLRQPDGLLPFGVGDQVECAELILLAPPSPVVRLLHPAIDLLAGDRLTFRRLRVDGLAPELVKGEHRHDRTGHQHSHVHSLLPA
jgi:hypothetical protein